MKPRKKKSKKGKGFFLKKKEPYVKESELKKKKSLPEFNTMYFRSTSLLIIVIFEKGLIYLT